MTLGILYCYSCVMLTVTKYLISIFPFPWLYQIICVLSIILNIKINNNLKSIFKLFSMK